MFSTTRCVRVGSCMTASSRLDSVRRWLRTALEDLLVAEQIVAGTTGQPRHACFWAQQSAEKTTKAALTFESVPVRKVHTWMNCVTGFRLGGRSTPISPT
ncbi:MAG: HEPN domain-containing protein [Dehalococcoidia bacterium]